MSHANIQLTFKVTTKDLTKIVQGNKEVEYRVLSDKIKVEVCDNFPGFDKTYIEIPRIVISIVS